MTGISGAIGPSLGDTEALARRMTNTLRKSPDASFDHWFGNDAVLCQVSHHQAGIGASRDGAVQIALWGEPRLAEGTRGGDQCEPLDPAGLVLSLYEEKGSELLRELDGSYAFAIYDSVKRQLLLANDRFSSHAVYWAAVNGNVIFGTQVHTVLQSPQVPRDLDLDGVRQFFHYQRVHGTRTLNKAVAMLAPGTTLTAHSGRVSLHCWFRMEYRPEHRSKHEWADELAAAFSTSTQNSMAGAPRVGLFISGGLDSRMVVAAADRPIHGFHYGSRGRDYELAQRVFAVRGFPFHYIQWPDDHQVHLFSHAVDIGDGLYRFTHAKALGLVAHEETDVMLHGFAPELFFRGTNLPHVRRAALGMRLWSVLDPDVNASNVAEKIVAGLKYSLASREPQKWFQSGLQRDFAATVREPAEELVTEARGASDDPYDWFIWADTRFHVKYPSFLFATSLRPFHVERSVTLQNHILDLHLRMPVRARADSRIWNLALERLNRDVARVKDANTGRSPFFPRPALLVLKGANQLALRVKIPTAAESPLAPWTQSTVPLREDALLHGLIEGIIRDNEALDPDIFDLGRVNAAMTEHMAGHANHGDSLALMATFGEWHRRYGPPGRNLP